MFSLSFMNFKYERNAMLNWNFNWPGANMGLGDSKDNNPTDPLCSALLSIQF